MPKAKSEPRSIVSYLASLPPDVEFIMERIRETIRSVAPDVVESIKYDMPLFQFAGTYLYVGAWKKHIGLYPIYPAAPALEKKIAPYRARKDTVQFFYKHPIPYDLVARIASARIRDATD
jgi:uncharacterized protein YdhG (YjbR/CyaY superfamily)